MRVGTRILSGDPPGNQIVSVVLGLVVLLLLVAPFVFPGTRSLAVSERILIFIVLAASYDMLLGYTGIVSFAHVMFFGMGAYGVAIALTRLGAGWGAVLVGAMAGIGVSIIVAVVIGLLSLRVRAIFFSMITLAVASFALILATELSSITGGEDGLSYNVPNLLSPGFRLLKGRVLGVAIDGGIITYYLIFAVAMLAFLFLLRTVNSPFGRVLQAIRENEFRAEALGFRTIWYRTLAGAIAAAVASLAGVLLALQLSYVGPDSTLSFSLMVDVLLMVVIGGMGTLYGAIIGAAILVMAEYYLQPAMGAVGRVFAGLPILPDLFRPERWLLWLGILFVLIVYFFPAGIIGRLRR
jgi:branched-chain amino acid transport system permease protein